MMRFLVALATLALALSTAVQAQHVTTTAERTAFPGTGPWAMAELQRMTLEQKIGQLFAAPVPGHYVSVDDPQYREVIDLIDDVEIGGVIFFQADPTEQAVLANEFQRQSRLPLLVSQDAEWGIGMRVEGATTFPETMALGASRSPNYAYLEGYITGREGRALGVQQLFAPVADINNNPSHPVINVRSFGEDPYLVASMVTAHVQGARDAGAIATVKHFPGHGDTAVDSHFGLPVLPFDLDRLDSLELVPFRAAIAADVPSVMTGHLSFPLIEPDSDVPATLSHAVTTGLLRDHLGFNGLVVTDALNMAGVANNFSTGEIAVRAVEAGADMLLMSRDVYAARAAILDAVEDGRLSEEQIDQSVERILRTKEYLGLQDDRLVEIEDVRETVATNEHLAAAEAVARAGVTLLRNENDVLPLREEAGDVLMVVITDENGSVQGRRLEHHIRRYLAEGSSLTTRVLDRRSTTADLDAVVTEAFDYDVLLIPALTDVPTRNGHVGLTDEQRDVIDRLIGTHVPSVLIGLGNPYAAVGIQPPTAYLTTYSRSEASQAAAAHALFGRAEVDGRLPITIPDRYEFGEGITLRQIAPREGYPEEVGMNSRTIAAIDSLMNVAIARRAFPGAAVAVGRGDVLNWLGGYGYHTYRKDVPVTPQSQFDMASLTKVIVTTTAVMKLFDEGRIDLDAPLATYLPEFGASGKERVTIRHILTHQSGLIPFRPFHTLGVTTREGLINAIMNERLQYRPGTDTRYSDLGMISIALAIERITGQSYADYVREEIFLPLGMRDTYFRGTGIPDPAVVPTEIDETFRGRLLQGEVHDEAAWILGGTAGHAGLFSTAADLSKFAYMMVNEGRIYGQQFLKPETIRLFTTRVRPNGSTRALGWDTRSTQGYSSAGRLFGPRSFGHTGFTGTSIWFDPDQKLYVILLANRVHPTRENNLHVPVRAELADIVYRSVEGPPDLLLLEKLKSNLPAPPPPAP